MKPASLNQKLNDAKRRDKPEKVDKTNNDFINLHSQEEITEYSWNRQFIRK